MARKKGGGGKLNRSEIVQARLNSKLRFASDLIARKERRTLSSLVESSLENYLKTSKLDFWVNEVECRKDLPLEEVLEMLWSTHEGVRFTKMGLCLSYLLTPDEEKIFNFIMNTPYFWEYYEVNVIDLEGKFLRTERRSYVEFEGLIEKNLEEFWEDIRKCKNLDTLKINLQSDKLISTPKDREAIEVEDPEFKVPCAYNFIEQERYSIWVRNISKLLKIEFENVENREGSQRKMKFIYPSPEEQMEMVERIYKEQEICPSNLEK